MDGADAGFLYMETPTQHMHTLKIAVLEPDPAQTFETFRSGVLARLDQLPPLRRKAVQVPFQLNHPVWVTVRRIDAAHHFRRHQVGGTGSRRDLDHLIGEIASTPLDRAHPLWELHLCEGLADGGTAIVGKMHHALADGMAANALLGNVTDVQGADAFLPREAREGAAPAADGSPDKAGLVRSALLDAIVQIALLPALLWRTFRGVRSVLRYRRAEEPDVPRPVLDAPRTSFNRALTARRSFATCTLPLADIKGVRRAHPGVTLNDVVLAVVGGALRAWLDERGEHPSGSLMAGVPTATDTPDAGAPPRLHGNRVSNLFTSLATDVDDPHERLRAIHRVTTHSKQLQRELGPAMLTEWVQFTPPAPFSAVMRLYSKVRAASWHAPPFNVVVSNVPGPRETARIGDASLADLFSVGPILEGIGLNVTVWSYVDRMNFSLLSCPELITDLEPLTARFRPALEELMT
ncbi:wax ester/triacylglycerol synthase family O-acyltransferase [Nocardioides sp.]|uniref:WS/DGAT/MGAT family O-acyltransferase n=1 Tax=Nocardioides sp. TaxID=35761 RepID=UPI00271F0EAB|nr:wax ester/triacylglycerol synthase family O-acyltransferase [Nocardioides sp.]MDO9455779.1 wax ester/triacylglycerol synthase family O-acyltransferase [Nocardioides sp.]